MLQKLWNDEAGQGMVEYGLIIAVVAVALIGALGLMKGGLEGLFGKVTTEVSK